MIFFVGRGAMSWQWSTLALTSSNIMMTSFVLLALCNGRLWLDSSYTRPAIRSFDMFCIASLNKLLNIQSSGRWFESTWRPCNIMTDDLPSAIIGPRLINERHTDATALRNICWEACVLTLVKLKSFLNTAMTWIVEDVRCHLYHRANHLCADILVTQGNRASATIVLTQFSRNISG